MASHASHCTTTLGIRADLAALHNHKHLLTATPSPGQSPLPQLQPTALAPPRAASSWVISHRICGTAVYKSWGLLQVVYHLLVTIHYSNSSVKPTVLPAATLYLMKIKRTTRMPLFLRTPTTTFTVLQLYLQLYHSLYTTFLSYTDEKEQRHGLTLPS